MNWYLNRFSSLILLLLSVSCCAGQDITALKSEFIRGYSQLNIPEYVYDYRQYFGSIPSDESLQRQQTFFWNMVQKTAAVNAESLSDQQRLVLETIKYETTFNLERLELERKWVQQGRSFPVDGLHTLTDSKEWYSYFIKKFTTVTIAPEEVFRFGEAEVQRVSNEIGRLYKALHLNDDTARDYLKRKVFLLEDEEEVVRGFIKVDSIVRKHLHLFVSVGELPALYPMKWPDAGQFTPPGIYLNHTHNPYGKDVFMYNFYGGRFNKRAMEWIYMHEGIPGHHLQSSLRQPDSLYEMFVYPGNFEGWACYVEDYGQVLGLYTDPYSELGKWEWDLVRSARLVVETGIHYYGWTKDEALKYWKQHVPGQEDIAEREITRVSNWPGQALSYKVGAKHILEMQEAWAQDHPGENLSVFRNAYLNCGMTPLTVIVQILK